MSTTEPSFPLGAQAPSELPRVRVVAAAEDRGPAASGKNEGPSRTRRTGVAIPNDQRVPTFPRRVEMRSSANEQSQSGVVHGISGSKPSSPVMAAPANEPAGAPSMGASPLVLPGSVGSAEQEHQVIAGQSEVGERPLRQSLPGQVSMGSLQHAPKASTGRRFQRLRAQTLELLSPPSHSGRQSEGSATAGETSSIFSRRYSRSRESVVSDHSARLTSVPENGLGPATATSSLGRSEDDEEEGAQGGENHHLGMKRSSTGKQPLLVPTVRVNSMPPSLAAGFAAVDFSDYEMPASVNKASLYVEDALEGRYKHGKGSLLTKEPWKRRCFDIHTSFAWAGLVYVVNLIFIVLIVFEPPTECNTRPWLHAVLEVACLLVFCGDIALKIAYMGRQGYTSKKWHRLSCCLIFLFFVDLVLFLALRKPNCGRTVRIARPLRPWLVLARNRRLRRVVDTTVQMALPLIRIFLAMGLFICLVAWIGVHLFSDTYHRDYIRVNQDCEQTCPANMTSFTNDTGGISEMANGNSTMLLANGTASVWRQNRFFNTAFDNPLNASRHLFVLLTSENYPYIMEPALHEHRAYFIYFVLYYLSCIQILALLLAVIVQFWISRLSAVALSEKKKQRLGLAKAFMLLDPKGTGRITEAVWSEVLCRVRKDFDRLRAKFVFDLLDFEQKGCLDVLDFLNISEVFNITITQMDLDKFQKPTPLWQASIRNILYMSKEICGRRLYMSHIIMTLVIIHSLLMGVFYREMDGTLKQYLRVCSTVIVALFVIEVILRLLAGGEHKTVIAGNTVLVTIALGSMICFWSIEKNRYADMVWGLAIALRMFWLSKKFQFLLIYMTRVARVSVWQIAVTAAVIYTLSDIGMQTLARDFMDNSTDLTAASCTPIEDRRDFDRPPYNCTLGFDSVFCGMQSMMLIVSTNDWHVAMGAAATAKGQWVYAYYIVSYIIIHYVFINLLVAIAIEMILLAIRTRFFSSSGSSPQDNHHVANFEVVAEEDTERALHSARKRSNSIVRGLITDEPSALDLSCTPSTTDLHELAGARQRTVVLRISKESHSIFQEIKATVEDSDLSDEELEAIQNLYDTMMKKKAHKDGNNAMQAWFDVTALQREKKLSRARLERPDLLIYALASIRGKGNVVGASGCLVLEVDGHANVASFSCTVRGLSGMVADSYIHTSDQMAPMFILPEFDYDPVRKAYTSHGVWKLKHIDRAMLLSERCLVTLCTKSHPDGECGGLIRVEEEIALWEEKKVELQLKCDQFSKISPILTLYAHRVEKTTLEDMLVSRMQPVGMQLISADGPAVTGAELSPTHQLLRTEGDGQSLSSMSSIYSDFRSSSVSVASVREEETTVRPREASANPTPAGSQEQLAAERSQGHLEHGDTVTLLQSQLQADGRQSLGQNKRAPSHSVSHPGAAPKHLGRLRKQGRSDSLLTSRRARTGSTPEPGASIKERKSIMELVRRASTLKAKESIVSMEQQRRLTAQGALFVSPDVQNIERWTAKQLTVASSNAANSKARRRWQYLAKLRVNKVGIAPTAQQQRLVDEEIQKPDFDADAKKDGPAPLKRMSSIASALLRTISTTSNTGGMIAEDPAYTRNQLRPLSGHYRSKVKLSMSLNQQALPEATGGGAPTLGSLTPAWLGPKGSELDDMHARGLRSARPVTAGCEKPGLTSRLEPVQEVTRSKSLVENTRPHLIDSQRSTACSSTASMGSAAQQQRKLLPGAKTSASATSSFASMSSNLMEQEIPLPQAAIEDQPDTANAKTETVV